MHTPDVSVHMPAMQVHSPSLPGTRGQHQNSCSISCPWQFKYYYCDATQLTHENALYHARAVIPTC